MKIFCSFIFVVCFASPALAQNCVDPAKPLGAVMFNDGYDVFQGSTARGWIPFNEPPCEITDNCPEEEQNCDTTPTVYDTPGTYNFIVPANCSSISIEAFGAGGSGSANQRGGGGAGGATVARRASNNELLVVAGGGGFSVSSGLAMTESAGGPAVFI